jgi:hypothetical protein
MPLSAIDAMRAQCIECGYVSTLRGLELHSCDVQAFGGRCEDYPACGHTDGDGCQALPEHTGAYWSEVLADPARRHLAYEPGSPEWYDALDDSGDCCPDCGSDELCDGHDECYRCCGLCSSPE